MCVFNIYSPKLFFEIRLPRLVAYQKTADVILNNIKSRKLEILARTGAF